MSAKRDGDEEVDVDDDWRSQMNSKYSGSVEYAEIMNVSDARSMQQLTAVSAGQLSFTELDVDLKSRIFDAIRFPPFEPSKLPKPMHRRSYEPSEGDYDRLRAHKKMSPTQTELVAVLDFLEGMLLSFVLKAIDINDGVIQNGTYVYALSKPPSAEESDYMQSIGLENLYLLQDDALKLVGEMKIFSVERLDESLNSTPPSSSDSDELNSFHRLLHELKQSLISRSNRLKHEVTAAAISAESLLQYSYIVLNAPTQRVCALDGFWSDWSMVSKLQDKVHCSNKSINFAQYMTLHGFPVCDAVFSYLQSSRAYGHTLCITDYCFRPDEVRNMSDYFHLQERAVVRAYSNQRPLDDYCSKISICASIHRLVIRSCGFTDRDCHALADKLLRLLTHLDVLDLAHNSISYSGVASLSAMLYEHGSSMRILRLDGNTINSDGAFLLAQAMHKLPFLEVLSIGSNPIRTIGCFHLLRSIMNPSRKAYLGLQKPLSSSSFAVSSSSSNATHMGDDSESDMDLSMPDIATNEAINDAKILRRKIKRTCYYCDFFRDHFSLQLRPGYLDEFDESTAAAATEGSVEEQQQQWVNAPADEFYPEEDDQYSLTGEGDDDDLMHDADADDAVRPLEEMKSGGHITKQQHMMTEVDYIVAAKRLNIRRNEFYAGCFKLVRLMMRVRLKLVAVSAFRKLSRRGLLISSLDFSNCELSKEILPALVSAVTDNRSITTLDLSHNKDLLTAYDSCVAIASLIERGTLRTICLNNCGILDRGFMEIARAANLSVSRSDSLLHSIELSGNRTGPTSANCIAAMCKGFHVDSLDIGGGFHATAPFKKKGAVDLSCAYDGFDEEAVSQGRPGDDGRGHTRHTKREVVRNTTYHTDRNDHDDVEEDVEDDGPGDSELNDGDEDAGDDDTSRRNIADKIKKKVGHLASGWRKKLFKKRRQKTSAESEEEEDNDDDKDDDRDDDLERRLSIL